MKKIYAILSLVFLFVACDEKDGKKKTVADLKPDSTGRINNVIIVTNPNDWKGELERSFKELIETPIPGLPQPEFQLNLTTIPHQAYGKMFRFSRNLLVLEIGGKKEFKISKNRHAKPQTIIELNAPTREALIDMMKKRGKEIIASFKKEDLKATQKEHQKNRYSNKIDALEKLGVNMVIPDKYRMVTDTLGSFLWMRNRIAGGIAIGDQTNELLVYEAPLFDPNKSIKVQILKNRDSIGKLFIKGSDPEKNYMVTEVARQHFTKEITLNGKKAYETRGTWELLNDFMAGPYLNYSIVDEKNNRVIVVEGFNYAPSVNKRDFVFELEAILRTAWIQ